VSDDDKTMGEVCDELQALGSMAYVDLNGKVWRLKYEGEVDMSRWVIP
jgi:hypothetical protein